MDLHLWHSGVAVANSRGRTVGWELDFLRGMHQGASLATLAQALQVSTGSPIRLMSIWLDKHAWVSWIDASGKAVSKRELADLAVIVRKRSGGSLARWMWLVQGKRTQSLLEKYGGTSTPYELDLFQRMPQFRLLGTNKSFDLKQDFSPAVPSLACSPWGIEATVPWTFMDFDSDINDSKSASAKGYSPIAPRWLGESPAVAGSWAESWQTQNGAPGLSMSSYVDCLSSIINGTPLRWHDPCASGLQCPMISPGGPIHQNYPAWSELYGALLRMSSNATSGHAKTTNNPTGSILQTSKFLLHNWHGGGERNFVHSHYRRCDATVFSLRPEKRGCAPGFCCDSADVAFSCSGLWRNGRGNGLDDLILQESSEQPPFDPGNDIGNPGNEEGGMLTLFVDVLSDDRE